MVKVPPNMLNEVKVQTHVFYPIHLRLYHGLYVLVHCLKTTHVHV